MLHWMLHNIRMIWVHIIIILLAMGSWYASICASSPDVFGTSGTSSVVSVIIVVVQLQATKKGNLRKIEFVCESWREHGKGCLWGWAWSWIHLGSMGFFLSYGNLREGRLCDFMIFQKFEFLTNYCLQYWHGTGLVSGGERWYNIVRY